MPVLNLADALRAGSSVVDRVYQGTNIVWEPPAAAGITLVGSVAVGLDSSSLHTDDITLTLPGGVADDDFGVIFYFSDQGATAGVYSEITTPSGWTLQERFTNTTGRDKMVNLWTRKLLAADGNPVLSVSNSESKARFGLLMVFRGVDTVTPLDVTPLFSGGQNDTTPSSPELTTVTNNCCIVSFMGINCGANRTITAWGEPAGTTLGPNVVVDRAYGAGSYDLDQGTAGATGVLTWAPTGIDAADDNADCTVALRAA